MSLAFLLSRLLFRHNLISDLNQTTSDGSQMLKGVVNHQKAILEDFCLDYLKVRSCKRKVP